MQLLRLDKILSQCGVASRREIKAMIKEGRILVNGTAPKPEEKFDPDTAEIVVDGRRLRYQQYRYIMMNKPSGYVSATDDPRQQTVLELMDETCRKLELFPAGRLDKDTTGLLLLTNDGQYCHQVISPGKKVFKRYIAKVDGVLDEIDVLAFEKGMTLPDGLECLPGKLEILKKDVCAVMICEGKYHQVKRMLSYLGKPVLTLHREKIGSLRLDPALRPGEYRDLSEEERNSVLL